MPSTPSKRGFTTAFKEPGDITPQKKEKRMNPPSVKPYEEPENAAEIRALTRRDDYTGLSPEVMQGKPHPVLDDIVDGIRAQLMVSVLDELQEAGTSGILDPATHASYNDIYGTTTRTGYLIYAIEHQITNVDMRKYIFPKDTPPGPKERELKEKLEKSAIYLQNQSGKFFKKVVKATRKEYNGDEFDMAPSSRRNDIWDYIFDAAPQRTTEAMLGCCATVIDLDSIFYHQTDCKTRQDWQDLFKTMFGWGCELMAEQCPGDEDQVTHTGMLQFYRDWRNMTHTGEWKSLGDLWDVAKVPIKAIIDDRGRKTLSASFKSRMRNQKPT